MTLDELHIFYEDFNAGVEAVTPASSASSRRKSSARPGRDPELVAGLPYMIRGR